MTYPKGTLVRNTAIDPDQPLDHRRLLRAADAIGPRNVPSDAILPVWIVWGRPMDARNSPLDRGCAHAQLCRTGRRSSGATICGTVTISPGCAPSTAFWPMRRRASLRSADITPGRNSSFGRWRCLIPVLLVTGLIDLGSLFLLIHDDRAAEGRASHPQHRGHRGHHRLDRPCLCGDLGQRIGPGDDTRLCDPRLGLAASSQMAAASGRDPFRRSQARDR